MSRNPNCDPTGRLYDQNDVNCITNKFGHNMYWKKGRDRSGKNRVPSECVDVAALEPTCTLSKSQREQSILAVKAKKAIIDTLEKTSFVELENQLRDALSGVLKDSEGRPLHIAPSGKKALLKQLEDKKKKLLEQYDKLFDYKLLQGNYELNKDLQTVAKDILFFDESRQRVTGLRDQISNVRAEIRKAEKEQQKFINMYPSFYERISKIPELIVELNAIKDQIKPLIQQVENVSVEPVDRQQYRDQLNQVLNDLKKKYQELFYLKPYLTLFNTEELKTPFVTTLFDEGKEPIQQVVTESVKLVVDSGLAGQTPEAKQQKQKQMQDKLQPLVGKLQVSLDPFEQAMLAQIVGSITSLKQ